LDKITDTTLDTHMIKNNEWDAVAYLTQSIYGRCTSSTSCTKIGINNNTSYITGYGSPAGTEYDINNGTYETILGKDASTTGNIYGVYDMSGGAMEYVMGVYTDGTKNWSGISETLNSGFSGCLGGCSSTYDGVAYPDSKYYNSDTTERIFLLPWSTRGGDCYLGDYSFYERKSDYYFGPLSRLSFSTGSGFDLIADHYKYLASRSVLVK
ncbi:MAG: hypothetical protein PUC23_02170, partial [bacterium]|nr:hypothetical protein [bacterium]